VMAIVKKKPARKIIPVNVATYPTGKLIAPDEEWSEELDAALSKNYPAINAVTSPTAKGWTTFVEMRDGSKVQPMFRRTLTAFIRGFMASEESYDE